MGEALITRRGGAGGAIGYRFSTSETLISNKYINFSKDCIFLGLFLTSGGTTWIRYTNLAGSIKDVEPTVGSISTMSHYDSESRYYSAVVPIRVKFANGVYTLTSMKDGKVIASDVTPGSLFFFRDGPSSISIIDL